MKRRYFTLLEVILAVMVIGIGMGSIWGLFSYTTKLKKETFFDIRLDRDLRETIALYEVKLLKKDPFFTDIGEKTEIAKEEVIIHGEKVFRRVLLNVKKSEDGKEALLQFTILYKKSSSNKSANIKEASYERYVKLTSL